MQYFIANDTLFHSIDFDNYTVDDVTKNTWMISSKFGLNGSDVVPNMTLITGSNDMSHSSPDVLRDRFDYGCSDMRVLVDYVDEESRYYKGPTRTQTPTHPHVQHGPTPMHLPNALWLQRQACSRAQTGTHVRMHVTGANRAAPTVDQGPCAPWLQPGMSREEYREIRFYPDNFYRGQVHRSTYARLTNIH